MLALLQDIEKWPTMKVGTTLVWASDACPTTNRSIRNADHKGRHYNGVYLNV